MGLCLLGLLLAVSTLVLALPDGLLLTAPGSDTLNQFAAWRAFAAERLRAGDLPLWNPFTYGGQPFLGGFQSALFYPPNLVFLALPLERALNLSFALHLAWLGAGTFAWARGRGMGVLAACLVGLVFPASGVV